MTTILPKTPSKLIRLALADLRACEADSWYAVDMYMWHYPSKSKKHPKICSVCLAGAVMAKSLDADIGEALEPEQCEGNEYQLRALDYFRCASENNLMILACHLLVARPIEWGIEIPLYSEDPKGFHQTLGALADAFEASGQ